MKGDDRFELEKRIGKGGQGYVWLAEDKLFGGKVAVKILHSETTSDATLLKNLLMEEARLQASLSPVHQPHRNIVYIIHVGTFDDEVGIVMEYVEGGSVANLMWSDGERKALSPSEAFSIALQVCEGLDAAHAKGVIHRDIKPGNILIRKADGLVKITDWGVAKNIDIAGRGRTYAGTPPFMSPEVIQLNRKNRQERMKSVGVDHRTDVYSLGVTLFQMLTGNLPFDGDAEVLRGAAENQEAILIAAGIESSLARMILRAMAARPEDRYETAKAFHDALQSWKGTHLISEDLAAAWRLYNKDRDNAAAERKFQEIIQNYPASPEAFAELARFYNQCSREDDAIRVLNQGIQVGPKFAALWNARGRLYAKRNSPLAVQDLEKALALGLPEKEKQQVRAMLKRVNRPRSEATH
jgi:serine/threonine protein kinase